MADDDRTWIEKTQSLAVGYHGKELTPDELETEWKKFDIDYRVNALDAMNADNPGELTVDEAAKRYEIRSRLRRSHEAMRRVGR